jgi:hypothetical protein
MTRFFCCAEARRSAKRELEFRRESVDARELQKYGLALIAAATHGEIHEEFLSRSDWDGHGAYMAVVSLRRKYEALHG